MMLLKGKKKKKGNCVTRQGKKAAGEYSPPFGVITKSFQMITKTGFNFYLSFLLI